ncbi:helix-turn-helix transcriptional regulator [Vulcanisaeta souniana]|nr:winged helix-turn-helix transcriptional regulator [Vulcanisaeta souniana]BDR92591.1 transcriptional regulator [Vulcanisaeta souniana JCM 11219]
MSLTVLIVTIFIYLFSNDSLVSINVTATQNVALINITLPVEPLGPVIVQNSSGSTISAMLIGDNLIIPVFGNGSFMVEYTPVITVLQNESLVMNVSSQYPINLFVSNNVLLTQIPINVITNFIKVNNGIMLQLAPGNYSIGFMLEAPTVTKNKTIISNPGSSTGIIAASNQSTTSGKPGQGTVSPGLGTMIYYIVAVVIAAISALLVYLFVIRHRGTEVNPVIVEGLNPTDKEVLRALMDMNGEAYQSDLQRKLNLPKATLWRAIRRLENSGYVQVIKEGRVNRIKLVRKPKLD